MNRAMIIGVVERDPELRSTPDGQSVALISVSTSRLAGLEPDAGPATDWFQVLAWGRLADLAGQNLRKDRRVYAEGHLQTRSWLDSGGGRRCLTEFVADRLIPLDLCAGRLVPGSGAESNGAGACLNRVTVIGNLGRDPEMRYTPAGQAVTWFSLAATRTWIAGNGQRRDATEWFTVVAWGSLAEICNQFLTKGRRVYVEGELHARTWEHPDGQKHFRTELLASEMIMLGPRPAGSQDDEAPS